jgi:ribosomal protein S18 acetylase RimI-like enzyme
MADAIGPLMRVAGGDLEMFGCDAIGELAGLLEAGERIGTVCFDDFEGMSPYAQISSLYVAPRWRARGVASHLLDGRRKL